MAHGCEVARPACSLRCIVEHCRVQAFTHVGVVQLTQVFQPVVVKHFVNFGLNDVYVNFV